MRILWIVGYILVAILFRFLDAFYSDIEGHTGDITISIVMAIFWPLGVILYSLLDEYGDLRFPIASPGALALKLRKHLQSKKKSKEKREVDAEELAAYEGL